MTNTHARLEDGSVWPALGSLADIEWELRYGDPARVRMLAAGVVAAYGELFAINRDRREQIVREVRAANQRHGFSGGGTPV